MLLRSLQNGYHIVCILSDNYSVNKKSFEKLSGGDGKYCIKNPILEDEKHYLFLAFDSVHIFKNIRNNWLNQNDSEQTFIFPDFPDGNSNDSANVNLVLNIQKFYIETRNISWSNWHLLFLQKS
jgi:hypothetical protein